MRYRSLGAIALGAVVLVLMNSALAQAPGGAGYRDVDLGDREAGRSYTLGLAAENRNCPQPLDFRFTSMTPWLKLPADPVVRQVPAGQTRNLQATLDLQGLSAGPKQAYLDVDCDNCGFLIFKNCKIDKQQLRFNVNVIMADAAPGAAPPQGANGAGRGNNPPAAPGVNYDDERIPERLRRKARAAYEAWLAALAQLKDCAEKLANLRAAAAQAEANAEKARSAAADAEQDLRNAQAQEEAAKQEQKNALKESAAAQNALADAEAALKNGDMSQADLDKAKARKDAADKRLSDANKAVGLYTAATLAAMKKDAADKKKAIKPAESAAQAAAAAVAKKEEEFARHQADANKAEADKDKAERDARNAIPVVKPPTAEEIAKARKEANDCLKELAALIEAQAKAMQALASLGALKKDAATGGDPNTYDSDLTDWAKAVDAANDLFDKLPPGTEYAGAVGAAVSAYVGTTQQVLDAIRAAIGVWSGVKYTGQLNLAPKAGVTKSPEDTKDYLKGEGLAGSDKEAADILKQMEKYSETNSTKGMQQELADKKKACDEMVKKAENMEKAASGK